MADTAIPVLPSLDLAQSVTFYKALGFDRSRVYGDYAIVMRGPLEIHFWKCDDPEIPKVTSCYIRVDDVDAYYRAWKSVPTGGRVIPVEDKPWGMREFAVIDGDGNLLKVGQVRDAGNRSAEST